MSRVLIREKSEEGSETRYRCPECGGYRLVHELLWERPPGENDPGKIDRCHRCYDASSLPRINQLFERIEESAKHPVRSSG